MHVLRSHALSSDLISSYALFSSSLKRVVAEGASCSLILVKHVNGRQYVQLLVNKLLKSNPGGSSATGGGGGGSRSTPVPAATIPHPIPLTSPTAPAAGTSAAAPSGGSSTRLVTTPTEAVAAVAALLGADAVAMDCEGDLRRGGSLALMQLQAAGGPCYLLDLVAMSAPARQEALAHLAPLLAADRPLKVLHDCRRDAEALFYIHGLRCRGLWDTQVRQEGLNGVL